MRELTQEQVKKENILFEEYWKGRGLPEQYKEEFFNVWRSRAEIEPFEDIEQPTDHTKLGRFEINAFQKLLKTLELNEAGLFDVLNIADIRIRRLIAELDEAQKGIIKELSLFNIVSPIAVFDFHLENEKMTVISDEQRENLWKMFVHGMCVTSKDINTNQFVYSKSNLIKNVLKKFDTTIDYVKEELKKITEEGSVETAKMAENALKSLEEHCKT